MRWNIFCYGNGSDRENLSDAVHYLLAVRSGLNLIHILSDNAKRAQARELAAVITGAGSITPLILVTTFFVMSVWALGEALMDVKGLLAGRKVMLFKAAEDWTLSAEKLLALGRDGKPDSGRRRAGTFLSFLAENPAVCGTPGLSGVSDHGCDRVKSGTGKQRVPDAERCVSGVYLWVCLWKAPVLFSCVCGKSHGKS